MSCLWMLQKNLQIRSLMLLQILSCTAVATDKLHANFKMMHLEIPKFSCTVLKSHGFVNHRQHVFTLHEIHLQYL